jgi:GNAT superfamily N-acetyltransferase
MVRHGILEQGDPRENQVAALVEGTFGAGFGGPYWKWKYRHPSSCDRVDVYTADIDGMVVAAVHYLGGDHRFGGGVVAPSLVVGDLVVDPDHRGKGVAGDLSRFASETAGAAPRPPAMVLMWTGPRLGRFYEKALGYRRVPPATMCVEKHLIQLERLQSVMADGSVNEAASALPSPDVPAVRIDVNGGKPLVMSVVDGRLCLSFEGHADLHIAGPYRVVSAYLEDPAQARVWRKRLRRRLRVKGSWRARRRTAVVRDVYRRALEAVLAGPARPG